MQDIRIGELMNGPQVLSDLLRAIQLAGPDPDPGLAAGPDPVSEQVTFVTDERDETRVAAIVPSWIGEAHLEDTVGAILGAVGSDMPDTGQPEPGEHGHELHARNIGRVFTADDDEIAVDHLYDHDSEPCPNCGGKCITAGLVGLVLNTESAMLTPDEALLLADRLKRAADLVLETLEDPPDLEREAARFGMPEGSPG
jgi:hypothetical protein